MTFFKLRAVFVCDKKDMKTMYCDCMNIKRALIKVATVANTQLMMRLSNGNWFPQHMRLNLADFQSDKAINFRRTH